MMKRGQSFNLPDEGPGDLLKIVESPEIGRACATLYKFICYEINTRFLPVSRLWKILMRATATDVLIYPQLCRSSSSFRKPETVLRAHPKTSRADLWRR